jgi:SAM-dependent methyltransferase
MTGSKYIVLSVGVVLVLAALLTYSTRDIAPDLAPFYPTPMNVVDKMLEMAELDSDDVVYDLGCGDGRIVIAAADRFGARGVGVEYDPEVAQRAIDNVRNAGFEDQVEIIVGDAMKVDVTAANVVTLYLLPESNLKLKPILEASLAPGSRVISHDWDMEGWTATRVERMTDGTGRVHTLYLWIIGDQYPSSG